MDWIKSTFFVICQGKSDLHVTQIDAALADEDDTNQSSRDEKRAKEFLRKDRTLNRRDQFTILEPVLCRFPTFKEEILPKASLTLSGSLVPESWTFVPLEGEEKAIIGGEGSDCLLKDYEDYLGYTISMTPNTFNFLIQSNNASVKASGLLCSVKEKTLVLPVVLRLGDFYVKICIEKKIFLAVKSVNCYSAETETQMFPIEDEITIGRSKTSVILQSKNVSNRHTSIFYKGDRKVKVANLSKNGTWVLISANPIELSNKDTIKYNEKTCTIKYES